MPNPMDFLSKPVLEMGQAMACLGLFFPVFRFLSLLLEQQELPDDIEHQQTVRGHSGKDCLPFFFSTVWFRQGASL